MSFYPCCVGKINPKNVEQKTFNSSTNGFWLTIITLNNDYSFAHIVTFNNAFGDDNVVYVSLNDVKQKGIYSTKDSNSTKSVFLRDLKNGDVLKIRGFGMGLFYK